MSQRGNVIVVSVGDFTFSRAKEEEIYAFPSSYNRSAKKYIAFYRSAPTGAVTHFAEIEDVEENFEPEVKYKIIAFGDRVDEEATCFHLANFRELSEPVSSNGHGIQGIVYTTLKKLKNAEKVSEL